ncbi:DUF3696 domain-containing protein [Photobacterium sp. NCIMB 13483]|uniref:AAA family ATPase n=1 Tax=Photobacterium sp. NCIMB 13483 TaxID=2022103 RepID=UPI000D16FB11|nr:DUF3696 domain-containing protein [Photobacterium sp. NCIMB 13483]PST89015.1 DUF3696 domain-containing protein [Photobacterium sp. NCIMB 13483]
MIKNIRLRNFKCYSKKDFELGKLTVFCGNNSVGKSTAIQSLLMAIQADFSQDGIPYNGEYVSIGSYSDLHKRNEEEDTVFFQIGNDKGSLLWGYELDDLEDEHYTSEQYNVRKTEMNSQPLPLIKSHGDCCSSIRKSLSDNFQYLCAERLGPKSNYPYSTQRRSKYWLGIQGEYSAQVLSREDFQRESLFKNDPRLHESSRLNSINHNIFEWLSVISPGAFVHTAALEHADIATAMFEFGDGEKYRPTNVGFGLSYALPIVMALLMAKPGGLVIIENPEAHLHPRGQSYLGRLLALTAQAGIQVIVETHSDHLLNGIRVITRLSETFDPKLFTLYYISQGEEQSNVDKITITKDGKLSDWPDGFFDQQAQDMFTIMTGQTQLPTKDA